MHRILAESVLADSSFELLVPASDSVVPDELAKAPQRSEVYFGKCLAASPLPPGRHHPPLRKRRRLQPRTGAYESLVFYLAVRTGPSAAKLEPHQLAQLANECAQVHVAVTLADAAEAPGGSSGHGSLSISTSAAASTALPLGSSAASLGFGQTGATAAGSAAAATWRGAASTSAGAPASPVSSMPRSKPFPSATKPNRSSSIVSGFGRRATQTPENQQQQQPYALAKHAATVSHHPAGTHQGAALGGQGNKERGEELLLSYTYIPKRAARKPLVCASNTCILFPLSAHLDVGRTRAARSQASRVHLAATLLQTVPRFDEETLLGGEICDPEDFDGINAYANLRDDPLFDQVPQLTVSNQHKRMAPAPAGPFSRLVKTSLPVLPALAVSVNTTTAGSSNALLAVCIERFADVHVDFAASIDAVHVQMSNAYVSPIQPPDQMPIHLASSDQLHMLYNVTLIDQAPSSGLQETQGGKMESLPSSAASSMANIHADALSLKQQSDRVRLVSISIECTPKVAGVRGQRIQSSWYVKIRTNADGSLPQRTGAPAFHGRRFEMGRLDPAGQPDASLERAGLEFSFHVMSHVIMRRVFRVQLLVVNHSSRERNLSIIVPQTALSADMTHTFKRDSLPKLHWETDDLVAKYVQQHNDQVSIACLESRIDLSTIPPRACQLVNLHYIVIKGQIHRLPPIDVLDRDTSARTTIRDALQLLVEQQAQLPPGR
ncbi:hypothetical protein HK105_203308 [Polyrhizophydium stewartii]|uniref:Trafficking protein particle complex II-specific subunit 65 IgD3 domain-containing protein n=1 Tax=Polyrhizophydium stewartii TaxID=2732419 RepID=A0ABR4NCJ2_9FUNG